MGDTSGSCRVTLVSVFIEHYPREEGGWATLPGYGQIPAKAMSGRGGAFCVRVRLELSSDQEYCWVPSSLR